MQVVYSGGSSTPTPSPRLQRKIGYSRPVMPGYMTHVHPQVLVQRSREKLTEGDTTLRDSIPAMSTCVASVCLILNIFIPGSGTLTAGLSVLCCSRVRPKGGTKRHCILLNSGVALMQFFLTFLFLLGWIWSITWGFAFLSISRKYQGKDLDEQKRRHRGEDKGHSKPRDRDKSSYSPNSSPTKRPRTRQHEQQHNNHHFHQHHHHQHQLHYPHHHEHSHNHQSRDSSPNSRHGNSPNLSYKPGASPKASPEHRRLPNNNVEPAPSRHTHQHQRYSPVENHDRASPSLPQPIIVLQKAPETCRPEGAEDKVSTAPGEAIMQARTRHMKILQRKMSDNDLSPFVLTNQQLEAIVIHDLPVVNPSSSSSSHNTIDETPEGLPKL